LQLLSGELGDEEERVMITLTLLVLAASALSGPAERAIVQRPTPRHTCVSVDVRPTPEPYRSSNRTWAARRVGDLEIQTSFRGSSSSRPVEFRVLTPGGHLYRTLSASTLRAPRSRRAPRNTVATARLSVAGTQITQRGIYGRWLVVPYLEGDPEPCGLSASFTLVP
jgi:hypothetical protein